MMRTILSNRRVLVVGAVLALVAFAYFVQGGNSGNTFAVGEVDIKLGNTSYYNGLIHPDTSWSLRDLTVERFFDFANVLPDDYGGDVMTLTVELEDSYLCADVVLTTNSDNGCTEPEGLIDASCGDPGIAEGELADLIEFIWWADDGDAVFEQDEIILSEGPIGNLILGTTTTIPLADTDSNVWTGGSGAIAADTTAYIAKAWCYGSITPVPLVQDGSGASWSPADDNDNNGFFGQPADGGFACTGAPLDNVSQTDSLTLDVHFNAVQAFGNDGYRCSNGAPVAQE